MTRRSHDFNWALHPRADRELVLSIGHALKSTHHYDQEGRELTSIEDVIEAMQKDGKITLKRKENTR